jgi:hypothetical protein
MVIVLEQRVGNKMDIQYIDIICSDKPTKKNDWYFVRAGWEVMSQLIKIFDIATTVYIFSDGCGGQFKNRYTQALMSQLSIKYNRFIHYNFFVSYHGHNIADSHAGHIKRVLLREFLSSQQDRKDGKENWGPSNAATTATTLMENVSHTYVIQLDKIARETDQAHKPNVTAMNGIKSYHSFVYDPQQPNKCQAYQLTNVQEPAHTYSIAYLASY